MKRIHCNDAGGYVVMRPERIADRALDADDAAVREFRERSDKIGTRIRGAKAEISMLLAPISQWDCSCRAAAVYYNHV